VTRPLFVAGPGSLDAAAPGAELVLDGEEGRHAATVRRIRAGERIDVADGAGLLAGCLVADAGAGRLLLRVEQVGQVPVRAPRLVLVQALAKGGRDEQAVETGTEFGVDAVIPWQADRCVVRWSGDRGERSRRRWEAVALAAAKQSRRAVVPTVEPALTSRELAARSAAPGAFLLVLHEAAGAALRTVPLPGAVPEVLLAVGPEGGIGDAELDLLTAAGGHAVRIGPEVLRSSSAGAAALAVLSVRLERW
jgi:16S rRNA (uracil1498-N3)-methyltransferase